MSSSPANQGARRRNIFDVAAAVPAVETPAANIASGRSIFDSHAVPERGRSPLASRLWPPGWLSCRAVAGATLALAAVTALASVALSGGFTGRGQPERAGARRNSNPALSAPSRVDRVGAPPHASADDRARRLLHRARPTRQSPAKAGRHRRRERPSGATRPTRAGLAAPATRPNPAPAQPQPAPTRPVPAAAPPPRGRAPAPVPAGSPPEFL